MGDMLPETDPAEITQAIAELLREHKGIDTLVLDLRTMDAWTDFFVITTTSSDAHLDGLERHIKELCARRGIGILRRSRKPRASGAQDQGDEWRIIDLGPAVIHLMSGRARAFYDLERLYLPPNPNPHYSSSSKSSSSSSSS